MFPPQPGWERWWSVSVVWGHGLLQLSSVRWRYQSVPCHYPLPPGEKCNMICNMIIQYIIVVTTPSVYPARTRRLISVDCPPPPYPTLITMWEWSMLTRVTRPSVWQWASYCLAAEMRATVREPWWSTVSTLQPSVVSREDDLSRSCSSPPPVSLHCQTVVPSWSCLGEQWETTVSPGHCPAVRGTNKLFIWLLMLWPRSPSPWTPETLVTTWC